MVVVGNRGLEHVLTLAKVQRVSVGSGRRSCCSVGGRFDSDGALRRGLG
jgi:hypothetical protein